MQIESSIKILNICISNLGSAGLALIYSLLIIAFFGLILRYLMSSINDIIHSEADLARLDADKANRDKKIKDDNNSLIKRLREQRDFNSTTRKRRSYLSIEYPASCTLWDKPLLRGVFASIIFIADDPSYKVVDLKVYEVHPKNKQLARSSPVLVCVVQNSLNK
jgi:hypothetical protein